ncbi:L-lactate permease [Bosea sp. (in: a-proteobacteria)]|uniref:L-lactate permease n=1 Tax=Bosea sp. (in: a-proteobacteria) TaxID=1871050 RepID=UPI0025C64D3B|nr:L-lactate permease [Bosea sp. (in: a-proteobacteria)]MBR3189199.1 L-lactate permease [Bosea sp. (in: a-proteobacteria)]
MSTLLSALPALSTILALAVGARSLHAALLGVGTAALAILLAFPLPPDSILPTTLLWTPILMEVLLIVAGGLLLSEVLRQAGGQAALASWISGRAGQGVGAILLVVHGVTPFAESLTGFGIGVTIGIPLLAHFGLPPRKVAAIGLIGLCAVPWGSMGPGTLIAATMSGLSFRDLGVASAAISIIPFVMTGVIAAWLAATPQECGTAVLQGALSGVALTLAIAAANLLFGTAPAGALGALVMIILHVLLGHRRSGSVRLEAVGRRALLSYAVLLGGVLAAGWAVRTSGLSENWRYLGSPALWLFIAAAWFAHGRPAPRSLRKAWASWREVAPVTGLFILLGILMAVSGMAAHLARTLAGAGTAYLAAAPFVGAVGGFVTGSNAGANAMFATTQAEIARSLGVDVLWFMAIHNVAAAFLLMASPGKIEMAVQLSPAGAVEHRRWVQLATLSVALVVVTALAVLNILLGLG